MHQDLYELSQLDKKITILTVQNEDSAKERKKLEQQILQQQAKVALIQKQFDAVSARLKKDEELLENEEHHIEDRRKQVAAMTGAKQAKLLEREIDVSRRSLDALESTTLASMEANQKVQNELSAANDLLARLEAQNRSKSAQLLATEQQNVQEIEKLKNRRESAVPKIKPETLRLYDRIRTKYPAEPVAVMEDANCRSCYRSLPANIVNVVLTAVEVQQCPGCNRILVLHEPVVDRDNA